MERRTRKRETHTSVTGRGESIAHCKSLDFTFLPFTFLPFEDREEDLEEGNSHFGYWEEGRALHIANTLTLPFYLLPFYLLWEDGAVSRSDTETPGAQASCDGLGAPSDS